MSDITANLVVGMPAQLFTLASSFKAASGGSIYIGIVDTDPEQPANQIQVYVEPEDGTAPVPVNQPIRINAGGYPVYNGQIGKFVTTKDYSMKVKNAYGTQEFYFPRVGHSELISLPKPVTWSKFSGGADPTGVNDSTAAFNAAYAAAENGIGILVPKGFYKEGGTTKEVRSDSLWLSRDFGLGVGIATETRKSPLLITVGNPDEPVLSSEHTRSGINITAVGRGGQHIDCIRATTINYSTNGNGNTAIYAAALSTPGALWTAALHGETKHQGNATIAISAESASYSSTGTFYGAVINNTTSTAAETHPSTGAPATLHPSATALYITGSNQRGEMGQWIRGIRFSPLSMREAGTLVRDESACAQGWWSQPSSSKTNADILLEGTAPQGIIIQGTYPTGNGIRLGSGIGIAYEGTGAIKTRYESSTLRWGLYNGAAERVGFHVSTPGMYFNGVRVVAGQQAAINNAAAGTEVTTINSILSALRNHGLIAS